MNEIVFPLLTEMGCPKVEMKLIFMNKKVISYLEQSMLRTEHLLGENIRVLY